MDAPRYLEIGDKIVIKDISKICPINYYGLKEDEIYEVAYTGSDKDSLYISVYGKLFYISTYKYDHIEFVSLAERKEFIVGDKITLIDITNIDGAYDSGFYEDTFYEIIDVFGEHSILITNGTNKLLILRKEFDYIASPQEKDTSTNYNIADQIIKEIEAKNKQRVIDEALDNKDYEKLKSLALKA